MEILLKVKFIDELPAVHVKHEALEQLVSNQLVAATASVKGLFFSEEGQPAAERGHLLDFLINLEVFQGFLEVKSFKGRP